jgi:hypothetical protein
MRGHKDGLHSHVPWHRLDRVLLSEIPGAE